MSADDLTPETLRLGFEKMVEVRARVFALPIVLPPSAFEPLPGFDDLVSELGLSLAEAFMHPERVSAPVTYVRPAPPATLDEMAERTDWEQSECYCVHCGRRPVIVEIGDGDDDLGPEYHCLSCGGGFYLG